MTNSYLIVSSIYANYIMQSIAVIVIMQFSFAFMYQLNTNLIGLGFVASGIGIGKVLMMFVGGVFSDRYGRKPCILMGMICYTCFFIGLIFCTSISQAFILTILAGAGNSFLDTGSMPALTELFPGSASSASVLIKGFISIGTFILPFIVTITYKYHIWHGYALCFFAFYLIVNTILLAFARFPCKHSILSGTKRTKSRHKKEENYFIGTPCLFIEGTCLVMMGFTISATFVIIMQWLPEIAMHGVGMNAIAAKQLISDYSMGSIFSVLCTAYIVRMLIKPVYCIILFPLLSALMLGVFLIDLSPFVCKVVAFVMGFTAAGGVLQLTIVVMQQLFPKRKGIGVGLVYTFSGLAFMLTPLIIPKLILFDVRYAILFDCLMALVSMLLGCIVLFRFRQVININKL